MKKNRKLMLLSVLVLGIWGTIGYRIVAGLEPGIESIPRLSKIQPMIEAEEKIELVLSYPDPFLNQKPVLPAIKLSSENKVKVQKEDNKKSAVLVDWSKVQYIGWVENKAKKIVIGTIKIGGTEYFVRENDRIDIFQVFELRQDSVKLACEGQSKYIKRKK